MKLRPVFRFTVALALVAALFSCTAQGGSIYAIIETAQKTYVATLDQTLTVLDIVKTADLQFPYLVAAGAVFKGTFGDANNNIGWPNVGGSPIPVAPPVGGALCTALTYFTAALPVNSGLFGAFFTSNGTTQGLYKSVAGPGYSFSVAGGATSVAAMANKQITLLQVANSNLCAVVATPGTGTTGFTYELDYSTDGTNFLTGLTGLTTQITGVGFISGNYFVTAGSTLYSGASLGSLSATGIAGFTLAAGEVLNGVTVDSGHILIPSSNGVVYYSTTGAAWSRAVSNDSLNSRSIIFLTVSTHVDTAGAGVVFLAGADGAGFYFLNISGSGTLTRFSDVTVTGLYAGAVRRTLVDVVSGIPTVFLGTSGTGLWRTTFDGATGEIQPGASWIHE